MNKAEAVFEKIALSPKLLHRAGEKARKVAKSLTGSNYKPKSFEEFRVIQDRWSRKMVQRDFLENAASKVKFNKRGIFEKVSGDRAKRALPTWASKNYIQATKSIYKNTTKRLRASKTIRPETWKPEHVLIPKEKK